MLPAGPTGSATSRRTASAAAALVAGLLLAAGPAPAQWSRPPFPGAKPTKTLGGPDLRWNGVEWEVPQGGEAHWTIRIENDAVAAGVEIYFNDDLPDPVDGAPVLPFDPATDVLSRSPAGMLDYNGDSLSWDAFLLALGESGEITFRTRVDPAATPGTRICNQALVTYVESEAGGPIGGVPQRWADPTRNEDGEAEPVCFVVASAVRLAGSTKAAVDATGDGLLEPGESVTYTITVLNDGSGDATSVVVTDVLPAGLVPVTASDGGLIAGDTVTWDETTTPALARLRAGRDVVLTLEATAGCVTGAPLCNQATAGCAELGFEVPTDDPATPALSDSSCLATAGPDLSSSTLSLAEGGGDGAFEPGETVTGSLAAVNSGVADAGDVTVRLPVPPCLVDVVPLDGGTFDGTEITWSAAGTPALASIGSGGTVPLGFTARVDPAAGDGSSCCAQGFLQGPAGCAEVPTDDAATPTAGDETCFDVAAEPQLVLTLTDTDADADGVLAVGELVEFELELGSLGGAAATDVAVNLPLPPGLFESLEADSGSVGPNRLDWDASTDPRLASVAAGETVILTGRGRLSCAAVDGDTACQRASATATNLPGGIGSDDPDEPGPDDPTCAGLAAPVLEGSTLVATEAGGDGAFERGEAVALTLVVTNTGGAATGPLAVELPLTAEDAAAFAGQGGRVDPDALRWDDSTTPALASLDPGASVELDAGFTIGAAASGRDCRQAGVTGACGPELSHDPAEAGDDVPTCWDVVGADSPPLEVPDGDPADGGPVPVRLLCEGGDLLLEWDAAPGALTHAVYRGPMSSFADSPWTNPAAAIDDPENALPSCDLPGLSYRDEGECDAGGANLYYLVAGRNLIGEGPLGESMRGGTAIDRPAVAVPCP